MSAKSFLIVLIVRVDQIPTIQRRTNISMALFSYLKRIVSQTKREDKVQWCVFRWLSGAFSRWFSAKCFQACLNQWGVRWKGNSFTSIVPQTFYVTCFLFGQTLWNLTLLKISMIKLLVDIYLLYKII